MLLIQRSQMQAFERATRAEFEALMVVHAREFSPTTYAAVGDAQMRVAVRQAIDAASGHGFTRRGPVQFYVELMLLFGSGVAGDPLYPWAGELLRSGDAADQMARADRLHAEVVQHLVRVHGPSNSLLDAARRRLDEASLAEFDSLRGDIDERLRSFFEVVHPEKCEAVGRVALEGLAREAARKTMEYTGGQDARDVVRLAALMFAFGHGCDVDPLYPWIAETLQLGPRAGAEGKMTVLERQLRGWLRDVLGGGVVGSETNEVIRD